MDLPAPPAHSAPTSRAPLSGLKFMLAVLLVFAFLAGYGWWEGSRREHTVTATIKGVPDKPATPSPNDR